MQKLWRKGGKRLKIVSDALTGPDDIPKKGNPEVFGQILFAKDKVEYHGQPLGLIVAKSQVGHLSHSALFANHAVVTPQVEAERGVQAVQAEYIQDANLGSPLA